MRVALIGTVAATARIFAHMVSTGVEVACAVIGATGNRNSDFVDLEPLCKRAGVPYLRTDDANSDEVRAFIIFHGPDIAFCIGWSELLQRATYSLPRFGTIGFHPTLLPHNRGRHPIIWALALGLEETGTTFFRIDDNADTGDIVSQKTIRIAPEYDAGSLYKRIADQACQQVSEILGHLENGVMPLQPQPPGAGNTWRKRSESDGIIDWRMSAESVCNLVRALAPPYPGASARWSSGVFRIWKARPTSDAPRNLEPGRVLYDNNAVLTVKCGKDAVQLLEFERPTGITIGMCLR